MENLVIFIFLVSCWTQYQVWTTRIRFLKSKEKRLQYFRASFVSRIRNEGFVIDLEVKMYVSDLKREFYDIILGKVRCFFSSKSTLVDYIFFFLWSACPHIREFRCRCYMFLPYIAVPSALWYRQLFNYSSSGPKWTYFCLQRKLWTGKTFDAPLYFCCVTCVYLFPRPTT